MSGRVVHFEIPADDTDRAQKFYREAFGWSIDAAPGMDYALLGTVPVTEQGELAEPGGINGGMMRREGVWAHPIITIEVDDIEAALKRVEELGGTVARGSLPVGPIGFAAYFTDTEGNLMGLFQPVRTG
ncbi:MAG TPA: glyoxalase [Actinobacteria bacterium]|nr:glyoxalase [Actinomycetota bacterium]